MYLLHERGKAMQNAVPVNKGSMLAVLGLKIDEINELLKNLNFKEGVCEIANDNADGQVIVSGNKENVEQLKLNLKENKIKVYTIKSERTISLFFDETSS